MKWITLVLLFSVSFLARATTYNLSCTYSNIAYAMTNLAQNDDVVIIGAGTAVIVPEDPELASYGIRQQRNVAFTLAGSGTNATHLIAGAGVNNVLTWDNGSSGHTNIVRDFDLICTNNGSLSGFLVYGTAPSDMQSPYHWYHLQMTNVNGRGVSFGYGAASNSWGCMDHCYMVAGPQYVQMFDPEGAAIGAWTNVNPMGSIYVSCVEDCTFVTQNANEGNGFWDSYNGAQVLVRNCLFYHASPPGGHGYDSGSSGIRSLEIYGNTFSNWDDSGSWIVQRGGSGMCFSNDLWGTSPSGLLGLGYYRACPADHNTYVSSWPYSPYLPLGVPGSLYQINFNSNPPAGGYGFSQSNIIDQTAISFGYYTMYTFVSSMANVTYNNSSSFPYLAAVLIGPTMAATITNLANAIKLGPYGYGVTYSNFTYSSSNSAMLPYEFVVDHYTATDLYLRNALDNPANIYGYPANQQQGEIISYPLINTAFTNTPVTYAMYWWSNRVNGLNVNVTQPVDTCNYLSDLVLLGRDIINGKPSASGSVPFTSGNYIPLVYPNPLNNEDGSVTNVTCNSSANPATFGVSFSIYGGCVTNGATATDATGTFNLYTNNVFYTSGGNSSGTYSFSTSTLAVGTYNVTAILTNSNYGTITSSILTQVVNAPASTNPPAAIIIGKFTGTWR